jgi:hypothetical protein
MSLIEDLKQANQMEVQLYRPYCPKNRHLTLPYAISLYQHGSLEGERQIEGNDPISFVASWNVLKLPAEMTRCRMIFDGKADLSYEIPISNADFVNFLIELIDKYKKTKIADFPQNFYKKLLNKE